VVEAHWGGRVPPTDVEPTVGRGEEGKGGGEGAGGGDEEEKEGTVCCLLCSARCLLRLTFHKQPCETVMFYSRLMFMNFKQQFLPTLIHGL
jgi:hypothetical protein